jgi:uncharacterized protein (TIGR02145 family)
MKTSYFLLTLFFLLSVVSVLAQQGINYKAIISDANGDVLVNTPITIQFTILENGTEEVYKETHTPTTDANGIVIVNIGEGTVVTGVFNDIDWGSNPHFLKTEIDKGDGLTDMGTAEFKTVPYAFYAKMAEDAAKKADFDILVSKVAAIEEILINDGLYSFIIDDRDENKYNIVKIGNQVWMAENLKYLPMVIGKETGSYTAPFYYVYGYDGTDVNVAKATANYATYGVLYNWPAAMNGEISTISNPIRVQGVCPSGWHLPSDSEWTELIDYLGGANIAGGKLKETNLTHWETPNDGATNQSGFTALPGGLRSTLYGTTAHFTQLNYTGYWWSSTGQDEGWFNSILAVYDALVIYIETYNAGVVKDWEGQTSRGHSVRCVKD